MLLGFNKKKLAPSTWLDTGKAHFMKCEYNEANQAFDKAIELDPNDAMTWNNKGIVLYHQNKYDEAIKAYDKAIRINPRDEESWDGKGSALMHQDKYDDAIAAYEKAIELNPKSVNCWYQKVNILKIQGKYDEAQKTSDKAVALNPKWAKKFEVSKHRPWYIDDTKMTYVATYDSVEKATGEANSAALYGWMPQGSSATDGHINLGRTAAGVALFGCLALLAGGSRSKGKVTITYVRTPGWLSAKNPVANVPTQDTQTGDRNDVILQLERLAKLKEQGILAEEEFQAQKKKILRT